MILPFPLIVFFFVIGLVIVLPVLLIVTLMRGGRYRGIFVTCTVLLICILAVASISTSDHRANQLEVGFLTEQVENTSFSEATPRFTVVLSTPPWSQAVTEQFGEYADPSTDLAIEQHQWLINPNWQPTSSESGYWITAYSTELTPNPAQAQAEAFNAAAKLIESTMQLSQSNSPAGNAKAPSDNLIRNTIANQLVAKDSFVQRIDRSYGQLYRAAVLVHASSSDINKIRTALDAAQKRVGQEQRQQAQRRGLTWMGGGMFAGLIVMTYLLLNTITRHYYLWQLRGFAVGLIMVGLLVTMMMT